MWARLPGPGAAAPPAGCSWCCRECSPATRTQSFLRLGGLPGAQPARQYSFIFSPSFQDQQVQNTDDLPSSHDMPLIRWRCWLAITVCKQNTRPVTICTNNCCSRFTRATRAWSSEQTCRGSGRPRDCFLKFKSCPCSTQHPPVQSPHLPATAEPWQ